MQEKSQIQKIRENKAKKEITSLYEGKVIRVYQETLYPEEGEVVISDIVEHRGVSCILPITQKNEILFVKQWRRAANQILLELPAGSLEENEHPIDCAGRELQEETGFRAEALIPLGGFYSAPGFCNEYIHLFLAQHLVPSPLFADDSAYIDLVPLSFERAFSLVAQGEIMDSKTLAALYLYENWCKKMMRPL